MKIKVVYENGIVPELDDFIKKIMEEAGLKWYAQGIDTGTNERDICFDLPSDAGKLVERTQETKALVEGKCPARE